MLFLKKIKDIHWLGLILVSSAIVRIIMIIVPARPWWDATVYLGMARYIESGGLYGVWEFFRPPLWPLVLSPFSGLGAIPLEFIAKILVGAASLGVIYLTYKIGEKYSSCAGLLAALCMASTIPFVGFSVIPMTEVPSLLFITLAIYLFLDKNIYFAGLVAGLAFTTRFPVGIIIGVLGIVLIKELFTREVFKTKVVNFLKQEVILGLGFLTVFVPYGLSNYFFYGDIVSPLVAGSGMITQYLWLYKGDWLFYVIKIVSMNPVLIIIPIVIILYLIKRSLFQEAMRDRVMLICITATALFLVYFSSQPHKEFRYIIAIYPSLCVMFAIGVDIVLNRVPEKIRGLIITALIVVASIGTMKTVSGILQNKNDPNVIKTYQFYQALEGVPEGTLIITTTPAFAAFSPVRILEGYNSWEQLSGVYNDYRNDAEYIAIDTCEVHVCEPGNEDACRNAKEKLLETLSRTGDLVYDAPIGICQQMIYKNHISR